MLSTQLVPFLTAYDPADKGGGSIDPLGFERASLQLADKILPGLTNVASQPRYFGLLCAGLILAEPRHDRPREQLAERLEVVKRLERQWALANVLASRRSEARPSATVRGVTYAEARLRYLDEKGQRRTGLDFPLLNPQARYGVIGIYGNVASGLGLWSRETGLTTHEFGEALGAAFLEETETPKVVQRVARGDEEEVSLQTLESWGAVALVDGALTRGERKVLRIAVERDGVRRRMAEALARRPPRSGELELERLDRVAANLAERDADLRQALGLVLAFEEGYAQVLLAFERTLWACSLAPSASLADLSLDPVMARAAAGVRRAAGRLKAAVGRATHEHLRSGLDALPAVLAFLEGAAAAAGPGQLVEHLVARHAEVQRGKFDRGRPKMAWVELVKGRAQLTIARALDRRQAPTTTADLEPHYYRTAAADAIFAGEFN